MEITLTEDQMKFVTRRVESGMSRSEQEVIDQALDALYTDELEQEVGEDAIRAAIEEGTAQLRRGEGIRITDKGSFADGVMQRAKKMLDSQ
ncbi:hypothetical protein HN371_19165 [Candidatus Poribacteria bacterium]|nr:hypothetical protein [Candidatus Poribacteria bacterium]MBT5533259.1 hypothetical protein [Candidatus Poribacteria bacterium]MBT5710181.1 hypothetical protein [Candidatus Poribacteria bacterium]MBT7096450.1 hypothetical protein [Candidatus Poribacteria bacterium]MBT7807602.1 hypothetical protein [Candidatus Poribacteria bacterium]